MGILPAVETDINETVSTLVEDYNLRDPIAHSTLSLMPSAPPPNFMKMPPLYTFKPIDISPPQR